MPHRGENLSGTPRSGTSEVINVGLHKLAMSLPLHGVVLISEAEGRIPVPLADLPEGVLAVSVPRSGREGPRTPRDRKKRLKIDRVDLIAASPVRAYEPPEVLTSADLAWVLGARSRLWSGIQTRFSGRAWETALALVRAGGVALRCGVGDDLRLGQPGGWRLSQAWASVADDERAELLKRPVPEVARREILQVMASAPELQHERELLLALDIDMSLRVPVGSVTGTDRWTVYDAAIRAATVWWQARREGHRLAARELAALALGSSKAWTPQRQLAFANLVGTPFDMAVDHADSEIRLSGPFTWRVGNVTAADAQACQPWVALPANGLQALGLTSCTAVGILIIENMENFEKVSSLPDIVNKWLCIWGQGFVKNGLINLVRSLRGLPVAAWCDLDVYGIEIVQDLERRVGRPIYPVGMEASLWIPAPKRRQSPDDLALARRKAARLATAGPLELRALAAVIAETGEACEQETLYLQVLPRLVNLLKTIEQRVG